MRGGSRFPGGMFGDDFVRTAFGGDRPVNPQRPQKAAPIENRLPCSLEDLYKGTTKKMKISREISDISGYEYNYTLCYHYLVKHLIRSCLQPFLYVEKLFLWYSVVLRLLCFSMIDSTFLLFAIA